MAKARKPAENEESDSTLEIADLLQLLSLPGTEDYYGKEIELPAEGLPDIQAMAAAIPETSTYSVPRSVSGQRQPPAAKKPSVSPAPEIKMVEQPAAPRPAPAEKKPLPLKLQELPPENEDSFEKIIKDVSCCTKCELCKTRKNTVPGVGPEKVKLVFIGEAPGADEDATGVPFVGKAGQHLDRILAAAGFNRSEVYICNILKCRPPHNRDPYLAEMVCCTPYLQRQLRLLKPSLIACLGNIAVKYVIGPNVPGITRIHGQWFESIFSIPTMAMYHPSYLIRSETREKGSPNWQMWQDIQGLKKRYDSLK